MIVWQRTAEPRARHTLIVTPGKNSDCSDFWENGRPKAINVIFLWGRAEVPDNLGRWLIDNQYARKTKQLIHIPEGVHYA